MSLFGKKKEGNKAGICSCGCNSDCGTNEVKVEREKATCCVGTKDGICCVKILGAGCKSCHQQFENAKQAVANMGLSVEVEYITDMAKVMEYDIMSMPALVVNEQVVSMGKVLKAAEVEKLLLGTK